jgi:hypothetical protein
MRKRMMKRVVDIEVTASGSVGEGIVLLCTVTGFGHGFLVHYLGEGLLRSMELESRYQGNSLLELKIHDSSGNPSPNRPKL